MSGSLLAFLAYQQQIKVPHEDIATLSLCHIIGQSPVLRRTFTKVLYAHLGLPFEESISFYRTQVTGKEKERPDIIGFDANGKEKVICEAKFYAALTENQPDGYLNRLYENAGDGLAFLCPENRITGLWNQLCSVPKNVEQIDDHCVSIKEIRMGVVSWEEVLDELIRTSESNGKDMMPDIQELDMFCREIIKKSFVPFSSEDFGADVAISMDRYYDVTEQTREILLTKKEYGITQGDGRSKLRSQARSEGFAVYLKSNTCNIGLFFDRDAWVQPASIITPFWVAFDLGNWFQGGQLEAFLNTIPEMRKQKNRKIGIIMIALDPPIGLTLDESAQYLAQQVLSYLEKCKRFIDK